MNDAPALTPTQAKALLVRILTEGVIEYRRHALLEMGNDGIDRQEVLFTLRGGVVEPAEFINQEWRYRVRRSKVYVVVTFLAETHTVVVTAWRKK